MAKVAVVHTERTFNDGELTIKPGERYRVIEEAIDFSTAMVLMQMEAAGIEGHLVDFGEGFVVFSEEPDSDGNSFYTWFTMEEAEGGIQ